MRLNLIQRIRNLWLLSNFKITKNDKGGVNVFINNEGKEFDIQEKPKKMAQIIKRRDPVKEALKNE